MRTVYYVASSLDGYIAAPHEDLDWLMQFDALPGGDYPEFIAEVGALAMGSSTYMWILERHVLPGAPKPMSWPYSQPAWVFTFNLFKCLFTRQFTPFIRQSFLLLQHFEEHFEKFPLSQFQAHITAAASTSSIKRFREMPIRLEIIFTVKSTCPFKAN